jgi:hypothetical protein
MTSSVHKTPQLTDAKVTRSLLAAILLVASGGVAHAAGAADKKTEKEKAQDAQAAADKAIRDLQDRVEAEEEARKEAEEKLAADEAKLKAQDAALATQGDSINQQKKDLDQIRKDLDAEKQARDAAVKDAAKQADSAKKAPPAVTAAHGVVGVTGFAQIDWAMRQSSQDQVVDSTGDPINEDRFTLRRARVKVTADYGRALGSIELDANTVKGTQVRPVGAEVSWRIPGPPESPALSPVMGTIGLFKIPFGYEVVQSDRDRLFLERTTTSRALFPGEYDLGARVAGGWRFVRYAVAMQNGDPLGEKAFPGRDPNAAKDITGRVGVEQDVQHGLHVSGGVSALTGKGFHKGTPGTKDVLVWRDLNEDGAVEPGEIQIIPGQAAEPSSSFTRFAVGVDARLQYTVPRLGILDLYGELVWASNLDRAILPADPVVTKYDVRELGWYIAATQELGPRWMAGVRYDAYNPDSDQTVHLGGVYVPNDVSYSTLALAVAYRYRFTRLILEYDVNRNHLGRDATGASTNLSDNALTLRGEIQF